MKEAATGQEGFAKFFCLLREHIASQPTDLGNGDSILALLYECYNELNSMDNEQIKADFAELYRAMNGKNLKEMDQVIYPVCRLCRDHERTGFVDGVKIGVRLRDELT